MSRRLMLGGVPGLPPQGSVWIVCALRVAAESEVTTFEQRVMGATAFHWDRFWTTPPLRPQEAVFEMNAGTYAAERDQIEAWVSTQAELGAVRVVHQAGA